MNSRDTFSDLLELDADAIVSAASSFTPSEQTQTFRRVLQFVNLGGADSLHLSRALLVAQELLASNGAVLNSPDCSDGFHTFLRFASQTATGRLRKQAIIILSLLGQMLEASFVSVDEQITKELDKLSSDPTVAAAVLALERRLRDLSNSGNRLRHKKSYKLPLLNIAQAKLNVIEDVKQDWFRDPWNWPELGQVSNDSIGKRLEERSCGWTFALDVQKSSGGIRPSILMNPLDRISFQSLADELSLVATKELPHWVFGWRVSRTSPAKGVYENNSREWKAFKRRILEQARHHDLVLKLDVRSFFESVNVEHLISDLGRCYKKTGTLARLADYLIDLQTRRNGRGLPQRSLASSVLAHVPLCAVDRYLSVVENTNGMDAVSPMRWMDDIWLFGNSESHLRTVSSEIEYALDRQGLGLNPRKTVLEECESAVEDLLIDSSGLGEVESDEQREAFAAKLIETAESIGESPRSDVNFMLKYIGENSPQIEAILLTQLQQVGLDSFTHAADRVAEFLSAKGAWRVHLPWYRKLVQSQADMHSWSVAAWGNMFPEALDSSHAAESIRDFFSERFEKGIQDSLVPLASNRVVNWSGGNANDSLFSYLEQRDSNADFFVLRAVALAARQSGLTKQEIMGKIPEDYREYESMLSELL